MLLSCQHRFFSWTGPPGKAPFGREMPQLTGKSPRSMKTYPKIVSRWCKNPLKIEPGTQQKTMLKNRGPKIKKYSKSDSKMGPKEWIYFGGNAYWGAFGGPNRFCDEKVGPQRCQSAPKARKISQKWHKRRTRIRKRAPKVDPLESRPGGLREALTIKQACPSHF